MDEVLETFAYCLLGNHFHLLVRVKEMSGFEINEGLTNFKSSDDLTGFKNLLGMINRKKHEIYTFSKITICNKMDSK